MGRFWKLQIPLYNYKKLVIGVFAILILHSEPSLSADEVLAEVDGIKITRSDVENVYRELPQEYRKKLSPNFKKEILELLIEQSLLYKEALSLKLDRNPEIAKKIENCKKRILSEELLKRIFESKLNVAPAEIKDYYRKHLKEFTKNGKPLPLKVVLNQIKKKIAIEKKRKIYRNYTEKLKRKHKISLIK